MNATEILNKAAQHMAERSKTYDKPEGERSMGATVGAFHAITGHVLTEEQGWLFMALLKAVRSQQGAFRADSYEDGAAYFALMGEAAHQDRLIGTQARDGWSAEAISAAAFKSPQPVSAADELVAGEKSEMPNFPTIDSGPLWIEWRGESEVPPVAKDVMVEVRYRDGETDIGLADNYVWWSDGRDFDIVAWRHTWPGDERIDAIGQNGATGEHY